MAAASIQPFRCRPASRHRTLWVRAKLRRCMPRAQPASAAKRGNLNAGEFPFEIRSRPAHYARPVRCRGTEFAPLAGLCRVIGGDPGSAATAGAERTRVDELAARRIVDLGGVERSERD